MVAPISRYFEDACRRAFKFLEAKYGFAVIQASTDPAEAHITYANDTTAVDIRYELKDNVIFVYLVRLRDGKLPADLFQIRPGKPIDRHEIGSLIELRCPSLRLAQSSFRYPFSKKDFEIILFRYADVLKKYATDILGGNFSVFAELELWLRRLLTDSNKAKGQTREIRTGTGKFGKLGTG